MRALLAVLLLTGLVTAYAQDVEWFRSGPHYLSEVFWFDDSCRQALNLDPGKGRVPLFSAGFSFVPGDFTVTVYIHLDKTTGGPPVWGGYGGGEFVDPADGMKVVLTPLGETFTSQSKNHDGMVISSEISKNKTGREAVVLSLPLATYTNSFLNLRGQVFGVEFHSDNGKVRRATADLSQVVPLLKEQFGSECLGGSSTTSTPFPSATSTRGSVQIENALGFSFLSVDKRETDWGDIEIYGEIKNNNSIGMDVKIEIILRDANGRLIDSADFLVGNLSNIRAGGSRAFSQVFDANSNFASIDIRVIDSMEW